MLSTLTRSSTAVRQCLTSVIWLTSLELLTHGLKGTFHHIVLCRDSPHATACHPAELVILQYCNSSYKLLLFQPQYLNKTKQNKTTTQTTETQQLSAEQLLSPSHRSPCGKTRCRLSQVSCVNGKDCPISSLFWIQKEDHRWKIMTFITGNCWESFEGSKLFFLVSYDMLVEWTAQPSAGWTLFSTKLQSQMELHSHPCSKVSDWISYENCSSL